jgi:hypothetical protein
VRLKEIAGMQPRKAAYPEKGPQPTGLAESVQASYKAAVKAPEKPSAPAGPARITYKT